MSTLSLRGINKKFDDHLILKDIDLQTIDNEFVVILGPSGCGKTTLLKIIAGLEMPTSGRVCLDGDDITDLEPRARDISMVFQNYPVYPHLNVFDNLAMPLKLRKVSKNKIREEVNRVADMLSIIHLLNRSTENLSGGELQRVAIGKALTRESKIFLMDEPLSDLDTQIKIDIKSIIKDIHENQKRLFVYVTHDHSEAVSQADRIAILNEGQIVQFDDPEVVYNQPNNLFVAEFVGSPKINILEGKMTNQADHCAVETPLGNINLSAHRGALEGYHRETILIGIRPENVKLAGEMEESQWAKLSGSVRLIEFLGNHQLVWINESRNFKVMLNQKVPRLNERKLGFQFETDSIILFDSQTHSIIRGGSR